MQQILNKETLNKITYLIGSADTVQGMVEVTAKAPFSDDVIDFLNTVSRNLMGNREAKSYSDVVTLAFWLRKASLLKLKERFTVRDGMIYLGRGVAFHIAPSNVPVNYAYSLCSGLLTGNANVVRIPSKDFPQIGIINCAIRDALEQYSTLKQYITLVRYGRDKEINDLLSSIADTRIVWGGDRTIEEIRKSPLPPRSGEISFADRFSFSIIDSDAYLTIADKNRVAEDFYNDTYLTDQNACTSPRLIVWTGSGKAEAKAQFWSALHTLVEKKYEFQPIMGINKLTSSYLAAEKMEGTRIEEHDDNLIVRVNIPKLSANLIDMRDSCGFFFEYDTDELMDLKEFCNDRRVQTVGIIGDKEMLRPLVMSGIKGIDRMVPIGKTMDFDLIWDGYNLVERLTRIING